MNIKQQESTAKWSPARVMSMLLVLAILFPSAAVWAHGGGSDGGSERRVYPALLEMAKERPAEKVQIIVQRRVNQVIPERALTQLGGRMSKDLPLINGFAMELPARAVANLAKNPAVRWISLDAPLVSTAVGVDTVRDEFSAISYSGNNGTRNWRSDWQEINDDNGSSSGDVRVASCPSNLSGNCLVFGRKDKGVMRSVNLHRTSSAQLTFTWRRLKPTPVGFTVEVRAKNGAWHQLLQIPGREDTKVYTEFLTIPNAYLDSNTEIRLMTGSFEDSFKLYVDDVQIEFTRPLSEFLHSTRAVDLHAESGLRGEGVTVAVVDSGISAHSDLQDGLRDEGATLSVVDSGISADSDLQVSQGNSRILAAVQFGDHANPNDDNGHGTHVAGIVGAYGLYPGIAPGVNLVNVKISNDQGQSLTSDLVDSLQWILNHKDLYNIRVVNLSLNSTVPESYHTSPINAALEILWFNGITVVVAAGNNGSGDGPSTLYPPANDPFVITVGATEDQGTATLSDDTVASFSAYGITEDGFTKPDLVAPGRNLISLLASTNARNYREHPMHRHGNSYFRMSGTSMSAPVVSGAVALLLQDEPNLTPDQVKFRLKATANSAWPGYDAAQAGAGHLDILAAVNGTTTDSANVGIPISQLLWTGDATPVWDSVSWNSVNWNSVNWNSVNWNSVNWNSVNWGSTLWED